MLLSLICSFLFADTEMVRVRIFKAQKQVSISSPKVSIEQESLPSSFQIKKEGGQWLLTGSDGKSLTFSQKVLLFSTPEAKVFFKKVYHSFEAHWNSRRGGIDIIYPIQMSDYLKGVIPSEMPSSWPYEALKAQVIASKSYVISQKKEKSSLPFDVDASILDQVYSKAKFESLPLKYQEKISRAVNETLREKLYLKGKVLKAYFHSHCGGHTENPSNVWEGSVFWQGRKDPYCNGIQAKNWSYSLPIEKVSRLYAKKEQEAYSEVFKIVEGEKTDSGRLENVFLFFKDGRIRRWETQDLRAVLGFSKVKSTRMKVSLSDHHVLFHGSGYGHGVGMCQFGAKKMALLGKSYKEILAFYYPDAELKITPSSSSYLAKSVK